MVGAGPRAEDSSGLRDHLLRRSRRFYHPIRQLRNHYELFEALFLDESLPGLLTGTGLINTSESHCGLLATFNVVNLNGLAQQEGREDGRKFNIRVGDW